MIQQRRVMSIPPVLSVRYRAPAAAALLPWYLAGGAPTPYFVYQPKGAVDLASSYINLALPGTRNAAERVAPTFASATGWTFNGLTQWLETNVASNVIKAIVCFFSSSTGAFGLFGASLGGSGLIATPNFSGAATYLNGAPLQSKAPGFSSGCIGIAATSAYRNGVDEGLTLPNNNTTTRTLAIGATKFASASNFNACTIQAISAWNTSTGHATWMPAVMAAGALI